MPKMKKSERYRIQHAFSATNKSGEKVWLTRANQHLIGDLLSEKDLKTAIKAGNIVDVQGDVEEDDTTTMNPVQQQQHDEAAT